MKDRVRILSSTLATLVMCGPILASLGGTATTTIYVGRHFEVRNYDQPTKYVFNGVTRVASITGSLSTNRRIQRLRLATGWNLVSLAVTANDLVGQLQQEGASFVQTLYRWNSIQETYSLVTAGQNVPADTVLWVKAETNGVTSIAGDYSDPSTRHLDPGGAYLAGTGLEVWSPNLPSGFAAWTYDTGAPDWRAQFTGQVVFASDPPVPLAPGEALYVRTDTTADLEIPDPALRIRYYHQDHLGSSSAITDATGGMAEEIAYHPFGAQRNDYRLRQIDNYYEFTQKERDKESGLDYFEARYLRSSEGRFLSPDAAYSCPDALTGRKQQVLLGNPQLLNLYTYGLNSPLRFQDPSGLDVVKLTEYQKGIVLRAQRKAIAMLDYAIQNVERDMNSCAPDNPADAFLEQWFGRDYGVGNKRQISANLRKIRTQLAGFGPGNFLYDDAPAGKARNAIAYVTPRRQGRIIVTGKFFDLEDTGVDTKAGTLIHEDSHPRSTIGTRDLAYGPQDAAALAAENNGRAVRNADNYEYFTEGLQIDEQLRMAKEGAKYFDQILRGGPSQ